MMTTGEVKGMFSQLARFDLVGKMMPIFKQGFYIRDDGRIDMRATINPDHPWVHVRNPKGRCCPVHYKTFDHLGFIPSTCLECWKVVVRPRTIVELVQLHAIMDDLDLPSKCGIETRDYVPHLYGAYFYCDSKDEGVRTLRMVRETMDSFFPSGISVILKRYCTEFEIIKGRSDKYVQPVEAKVWEPLIAIAFDLDEIGRKYCLPQPPWLIQHIMRTWVEFAFKNGDVTVRDVNDGDPLYSSAVTYGDGK